MTTTLQEEVAVARTRVQQQRAEAQNNLDAAHAALAERPAESALLAAVSKASRTLAEVNEQMQHLDAAAQHATKAAAAAERVERKARRKQQRQQIVKMTPVLDEAAGGLIAHIERLGPLLANWAALADDHSALCVGLAREAESDLKHGSQRLREQLEQVTDPTRGPLIEAVAAAFWNAGLGRVGPDLSTCGLSITWPGRDNFRADPLAALAGAMKDVRSQIAGALDRADAHLAERDAREA
ncbi:MAG: hypothetical protein IV107_03890 [Paucibacter sp.]|nr:hypothetical protein [Roseateles sp.]